MSRHQPFLHLYLVCHDWTTHFTPSFTSTDFFFQKTFFDKKMLFVQMSLKKIAVFFKFFQHASYCLRVFYVHRERCCHYSILVFFQLIIFKYAQKYCFQIIESAVSLNQINLNSFIVHVVTIEILCAKREAGWYQILS